MKKAFKVALGCVCAASMMAGVACGDKGGNGYTTQETLNGKTAEEKYTEIMATIDGQSENFSSLIQYDIHCDVSMDGMNFGMDLELTSTVKMNGDDFYASDFVDAGSLQGMDLGTKLQNVWYVDGVAYLDMDVTGDIMDSSPIDESKMTVSMEELCQAAGLEKDNLFNPLYDFSDTAFEDVQFNVGESDSYFEIVMKGDDAAAYAQTVLSKQGLAGQLSIPQVNYKFIMDKDGNFDYVKIDFDVNVNSSGVTFKYKYDGKITFSDIGTTVVTAPAGSEDWTDLRPGVGTNPANPGNGSTSVEE
ncbi:MAG: hypothetical protein IJ373_02345 [Clostridia bacterium]|nr:hypothetical protein [Clostridia bacterium]MBQ8446810.1 hypothetical protein [Clostridia bacterium]